MQNNRYKTESNGRVDRRQKAVENVEYMSKKYASQINDSINSTVLIKELDTNFVPTKKCDNTDILIEKCYVDKAIQTFANNEDKICILNFASFHNPGGGYLKGALAQEEALCAISYLYNVLSSERIMDMFYNKHEGRTYTTLYNDDLLYTEKVIFHKKFSCDVITCAAPNRSAYLNSNKNGDKLVTKALQQRCELVLQVAAKNNVDVLLLGAWGCGVFGNNPSEIAEVFKALLDTKYKNIFKKVVFPIPDDKNYNSFIEQFN